MLIIMCYMKMSTKQLKTAMNSDKKSKAQHNVVMLYFAVMFKTSSNRIKLAIGKTGRKLKN